mgnify:CR=1 FL=1
MRVLDWLCMSVVSVNMRMRMDASACVNASVTESMDARVSVSVSVRFAGLRAWSSMQCVLAGLWRRGRGGGRWGVGGGVSGEW